MAAMGVQELGRGEVREPQSRKAACALFVYSHQMKP